MEDRVFEHVDIDTRRALGLPPRRLTYIPDIRFPKRRSGTFGDIMIRNSPFGITSYFTAYTYVQGVYYICETEYSYDLARVVTRLSGGASHHRLYQIVETPGEAESFVTAELWKVHRQFERLRSLGL